MHCMHYDVHASFVGLIRLSSGSLMFVCPSCERFSALGVTAPITNE